MKACVWGPVQYCHYSVQLVHLDNQNLTHSITVRAKDFTSQVLPEEQADSTPLPTLSVMSDDGVARHISQHLTVQYAWVKPGFCHS